MIEIVSLAHYTHQIADVILILSPTSVRWTLQADEMTLVGFSRWDTNVCAERMAASALLGQMLTEHLHLERKDPRVYSREDAVSMGVPLKKRKKEKTGEAARPNAYNHWMHQEYEKRDRENLAQTWEAWRDDATMRWHALPLVQKKAAAAAARLESNDQTEQADLMKASREIARAPVLETVLAECGDNQQPLRAEAYDAAIMEYLGNRFFNVRARSQHDQHVLALVYIYVSNYKTKHHACTRATHACLYSSHILAALACSWWWDVPLCRNCVSPCRVNGVCARPCACIYLKRTVGRTNGRAVGRTYGRKPADACIRQVA